MPQKDQSLPKLLKNVKYFVDLQIIVHVFKEPFKVINPNLQSEIENGHHLKGQKIRRPLMR